MTRKVLLAGAPDYHRLDWAPSNLLTTFQPSIAQFALLQPPAPPSTVVQDISYLDLAVWRSLSLQRTHIRTGFSQQHDLRFVGAFPSSADFLTTASISFGTASQALSQQDADDETSRLVAEFYEHSLAVHHDMASSQIVPQQDSQKATSFNTDVSSMSDTTSSAKASEEGDSITVADGTTLLKAPLRPGRSNDHLSDLEDIPPASYLISIIPATMTVTLIVGIISIAAPRTIKTHYGATKTLVEVLVGDETKSGFSVTFWLADEADEGALAGLRSQDVVLMQNVALNVFRNRVYGGSLRRGMTRVALLYRGRKIGSDDEDGYYLFEDLAKAGRGKHMHPQLDKTRRVRDWVLKFVGGGGAVERKGPRTRKGKDRTASTLRDWNQPPPLDSQ
ncbi:hypothetical protein N0V82_001491 [Gnomoniopsis sp. IMI 355080]|nr:hypothetical protein N0V82_001491 [Gnomoniopsis sp. IMI 355080]